MVKVLIISFSYSSGVPEDPAGHGGGFVFDCRGLPNPFWEDGLKGFSGKDGPIQEFFAKNFPAVESFASAVEALVRQTTAVYLADGRQDLLVAFGCTGGQHRSVFMAEELARRLAGISGLEITVQHREEPRWRV